MLLMCSFTVSPSFTVIVSGSNSHCFATISNSFISPTEGISFTTFPSALFPEEHAVRNTRKNAKIIKNSLLIFYLLYFNSSIRNQSHIHNLYDYGFPFHSSLFPFFLFLSFYSPPQN